MEKSKISFSERIHFIGIGGIGMSGLAEVMKDMGFNVQGSDIANNKNIERCRKNGIKIFLKHNKRNIRNSSIIVKSSAIGNNNPEIIFAKSKKLKILKRAEMLGELIKLKDTSIAISGTHGKTTSCSMLSCILIEARLNPTVIIGGIVNNFGSNTLSGNCLLYTSPSPRDS